MSLDPIVGPGQRAVPFERDLHLSPLTWGEVMSFGASIHSDMHPINHYRNWSRIRHEQEYVGKVEQSAPCRLDEVVDRLLRECFARK